MKDNLRIFASFSTALSLDAICSKLNSKLTVRLKHDHCSLRAEGIDLQLSECGPREFLMRGEAESVNQLQDLLIAQLHNISDDLHMDIFEEDGRLVKRIYSENN